MRNNHNIGMTFDMGPSVRFGLSFNWNFDMGIEIKMGMPVPVGLWDPPGFSPGAAVRKTSSEENFNGDFINPAAIAAHRAKAIFYQRGGTEIECAATAAQAINRLRRRHGARVQGRHLLGDPRRHERRGVRRSAILARIPTTY